MPEYREMRAATGAMFEAYDREKAGGALAGKQVFDQFVKTTPSIWAHDQRAHFIASRMLMGRLSSAQALADAVTSCDYIIARGPELVGGRRWLRHGLGPSMLMRAYGIRSLYMWQSGRKADAVADYVAAVHVAAIEKGPRGAANSYGNVHAYCMRLNLALARGDRSQAIAQFHGLLHAGPEAFTRLSGVHPVLSPENLPEFAAKSVIGHYADLLGDDAVGPLVARLDAGVEDGARIYRVLAALCARCSDRGRQSIVAALMDDLRKSRDAEERAAVWRHLATLYTLCTETDRQSIVGALMDGLGRSNDAGERSAICRHLTTLYAHCGDRNQQRISALLLDGLRDGSEADGEAAYWTGPKGRYYEVGGEVVYPAAKRSTHQTVHVDTRYVRVLATKGPGITIETIVWYAEDGQEINEDHRLFQQLPEARWIQWRDIATHRSLREHPVRDCAAECLGRIYANSGNVAIQQKLAAAIAGSGPFAKVAMLSAITGIGATDYASMAMVAHGLGDSYWVVRRAAAHEIRELSATQCLPLLRRHLERERVPPVRDACERAIKALEAGPAARPGDLVEEEWDN